ncbi:hypothetical protein Lser_V15G01927 [Lactuca serriola]
MEFPRSNNLQVVSGGNDDDDPEILVSKFDSSIDNHFQAMDKIANLSGESEFQYPQIQRFSSSFTFLREWRNFCYQPRAIKFACESHEKNVTHQIKLPQFSSALVPKDTSDGNKDFVMYVGGHVWALDWCPILHQNSNTDINVEFVAVAAHPPESSYHKIGAPLTGRGLIQIWCLLNAYTKEQDMIPLVKVKPKRNEETNLETNQPKKPRGRPRKNASDSETVPVPNTNSYPQPLAIEFPQHSKKLVDIDKNTPETAPQQPPKLLAIENHHHHHHTPESVPNSNSVSKDIALPRLVMGLAHNGKVAWDVKWRPDSHDISSYRMGYLAVLLGNGALEVWEVPVLSATKALFSSCQKEGTDPRFLKLKPVFMCSKLKCGDRQSIPLTLEWSTSAPHDLILAGCHDGVVALWKFSTNDSSIDTKPLLCFSADTVPIRALKWAPLPSDPESANIIATSGHKGVRFWDIRDPYHPLWDIPLQKITYSLDWHPDPRCVILSSDDGEIKIINLSKAVSDTPVTATPTVKTQHHGSHSYYCSSSSIWCVHVSRLTDMVAYCCSDGKVIHFKLTTKSVERDPNRNREPHYLCGSVTKEEEKSTLTVLTPSPNIPFPMKKSSNEWGDTPRSKRGFVSITNQEKRAKEYISKENPKNKNKSSQALACIDDVANNVKDHMAHKEEDERETLPPKIVAMHRVRWNMNKGSEKWLCYGGAAGILRFQEINLLGNKKEKRKTLHDLSLSTI